MNGNKTALALYEIDSKSLAELKKYSLKSIYFYLDKKMYGATVTENKSLFINQFPCFK